MARPTQWITPGSVREAVTILGDAGTAGIGVAGATSMTPRVLATDPSIEVAVDLLALGELTGVTADEGCLVIGAATPLREIASSPLVERAAPILRACARGVADEVVQRQATIGGNIAARNGRAFELATVMTALDARMEITGPRGTRTVDCMTLEDPDFQLDPGELIIRFEVLERLAAGSYAKATGNVPAYPVGAVCVSSSPAPRVRVVVNPGDGRPRTLVATEQAVAAGVDRSELQTTVRDEIAAAEMVDDVFGSTAFRRHALTTLMQRALDEVLQFE